MGRKKMAIDTTVHNNTAKCPECTKKMYYSRKGRIYFYWVGLIDNESDVIEHHMCPFCTSIYNRWSGEKIVNMPESASFRATSLLQKLDTV